VTVVVLVCVVCPVLVTVTVYVPTGIQVVAKRPVEAVEPGTTVAMLPPLIVNVAPLTILPLAATTLTVIFPEVAIGRLRVLVPPAATFTAIVWGR